MSLPVLESHQDPTLHLLTLSSKSSPIFNSSSIYVFYTQDSPLMWVFLILSHEQSKVTQKWEYQILTHREKYTSGPPYSHNQISK